MTIRTLATLLPAFGIVACRAEAPAPAEAPKDVVLARVNSLPVFKSDFLATVRAGRLGGSPELVLDELLGLTLVLRECEVMVSPTACLGPGLIVDRARPFLEKLFPPERACGVITESQRGQAWDRLRGHQVAAAADPKEPAVREVIDAEVCRAKAFKLQRTFVQGLRKDAHVVVDRDEYAKAVAELEASPTAVPVAAPAEMP